MSRSAKKPSRKQDQRQSDWPRGLRHRGSGFYYERVHEGRRYKFSFSDLSEAEAIAKAMEVNLKLRAGVDLAVQARRETTSFIDFAEKEYLVEKRTSTKPRSFERYRGICEQFAQYLDEQYPEARSIADVTEEMAQAYRRHRRTMKVARNGKPSSSPDALSNGVKPQTMYVELSTLRSAFKMAQRRGLIQVNPFEEVQVAKRQFSRETRQRILTPEEVNNLLQAAKRYDARLLKKNADPLTASFHDIYFTFLHTGLRYNELVHLEWRDVDLRGGVLLVREKEIVEDRCCQMLNGEADIWGDLVDGKEDEDKVFSRAAQAEKLLARVRIRKIDDLLSLEVGDIDLEAETIHLRKSYVWSPKGSNGRVPISPKLVKLLAGRKKLSESRSQFVFPAPDGGKCRLHLLDVLQRLARKLKLPEPLPRVHDLRHSFASTLRRNGVPLESIMGLMRHSSIRETLRYAPYHEEEGRAAIATLDKLF